jgi:hypothetical protein
MTLPALERQDFSEVSDERLAGKEVMPEEIVV